MKNIYVFITTFLLSAPLLAMGPKGGSASSGDLRAGTNETITGDWVFQGNVDLGNASGDTITIYGYTIHNASITVNQGVTIGSATVLNGNFTNGDASGDINTINAASHTFVNDTVVSLQGGANGISFGINGTNALSVDATNSSICVGAGCTAPDYANSLQVGENVATPILQIDKSAGGNGILLWSTAGSATNSGRITLDATEVLIIETDASGGAITITPTDTEIARFTSTTVGINDTSADATLEVKSNVAATNFAVQISSQDDTAIIWGVTGDGGMWMDMLTSTPTSGTNRAGLAAISEGGVAELKAIDEDDNVTKISPHNEKGEWVFYSENMRTGKRVFVNMEKFFLRMEEITGEKFIEISNAHSIKQR